jgi:HK97 family phage portal protein
MKLISKLLSKCGYIPVSAVSDTITMRQWNQFFPIATAGEHVTPDTALRLTAVMACVRIIAENIGSLPAIIYKRGEDDKRTRAKDHPVYKLLHVSPNEYQTPMQWKELMAAHVVLRGNAYSVIDWDASGEPIELHPVHPDRVTIERLQDKSLRYKIRFPDENVERKYSQDRILHIAGLSFDGVKGLNPIEYAATTIGLGLATDKFGGSFFANGANPAAVLSTPQRLSEQAVNSLKQQLAQEYSGAKNSFKTLVLQEDLKWTAMIIPPDQAQFLETRKFSVTDIARLFRVPPPMIADLERATFSNIEQQSIDLVTYTLRPWMVRFDQSINKRLLLDSEEYYCEFLADALLRGDQKSRYESYSLALASRWMTPNEVRKRENLDPIEGGDKVAEKTNLSSGSTGGSKIPKEPEEKDKALHAWIEDVSQRLANKVQREPIANQKGRTDHAKYMFQCLAPLFAAIGIDCVQDRFTGMDRFPDTKADYVQLIQGMLDEKLCQNN